MLSGHALRGVRGRVIDYSVFFLLTCTLLGDHVTHALFLGTCGDTQKLL